MAEAIGMDRSYWGDLERGERAPTLYNLWRMAMALDTSPSRLVLAIDQRYQRIRKGTIKLQTPTEQQLAHLRQFMDEAYTMKWLANPQRENIYCNKPLLDWLGRKLEEIQGNGWKKLMHPEDRNRDDGQNARRYARREPYVSRYRMLRADQTYQCVAQQAVPMYTPKGVFLGFMGTMIEITEPGERRD